MFSIPRSGWIMRQKWTLRWLTSKYYDGITCQIGNCLGDISHVLNPPEWLDSETEMDIEMVNK